MGCVTAVCRRHNYCGCHWNGWARRCLCSSCCGCSHCHSRRRRRDGSHWRRRWRCCKHHDDWLHVSCGRSNSDSCSGTQRLCWNSYCGWCGSDRGWRGLGCHRCWHCHDWGNWLNSDCWCGNDCWCRRRCRHGNLLHGRGGCLRFTRLRSSSWLRSLRWCSSRLCWWSWDHLWLLGRSDGSWWLCRWRCWHSHRFSSSLGSNSLDGSLNSCLHGRSWQSCYLLHWRRWNSNRCSRRNSRGNSGGSYCSWYNSSNHGLRWRGSRRDLGRCNFRCRSGCHNLCWRRCSLQSLYSRDGRGHASWRSSSHRLNSGLNCCLHSGCWHRCYLGRRCRYYCR